MTSLLEQTYLDLLMNHYLLQEPGHGLLFIIIIIIIIIISID